MDDDDPIKKRRGGRLQRTSHEPSSSLPSSRPGHLADLLLMEHAYGFLSGPQVQRFAYAAHQDGLTLDSISKLASLGPEGKHPQNIGSQLKTFLRGELAPHGVPVLKSHEVPVKIKKGPMS